jgi:SAM-dependent methyltransferase
MSFISESENTLLIQTFISSIGLKECQSNEEFWKHLEKSHEEKVLDQLEQALIAHNEDTCSDGELYQFKNQNLKLSLDVSSFSTDLYIQYFRWFVKHSTKKPKKILDLGCDNGIATCFYGMLFPESEVVGIDIQENAIKCAKELATMLNLSNVTFVKMDFKNVQNHFDKYSFEIITSLRSFHEMVRDFPVEVDYLMKDTHIKTKNPILKKELIRIKDLLMYDTSEFITCERISGFDSVTSWIQTMENAGLNVLFNKSNFIQFHEIGQEQQMPVLVSTKQKSDLNIVEGIHSLFR